MSQSLGDIHLRIIRFMRTRGNVPVTSAAMQEEGFKDVDKVRFQLVCSGMAAKPPHQLVKLDNPGSRGSLWRLREPDDPAYVEPVKVPRHRKVIENDKPAAAIAPIAMPSRISHRDVGMVAETPAHIRAMEHTDTRHIEHFALGNAPPNNALAEALAKAKPVKASFAKTMPYVAAPEVKVQVIPAGESSKPARGCIQTREFTVSATAFETPVPTEAPTTAPTTAPVATVQGDPNGSLGAALETVIRLAGPQLKQFFVDIIREAFNVPVHTPVQAPPDTPAPAPAAVAPAAAAPVEEPLVTPAATIPQDQFEAPPAPPVFVDERKTERRHKALMPGEIDQQRKIKLPKVTVIGIPKPAWAFEVKDKFKKWADVKTVSVDSKGKTARDFCRGSDVNIIMADYCSHAMQQSLVVGNIQFEVLRGGSGKLEERIKEIITSYQSSHTAQT